jgi:predicted dehydrogenase
VSRPLRFHPLFDAVPEGARAQLVTARARWASGGGPCQRQALTDALDLCGVLAGSRGGAAGVRRLDAQAAPPSSDGASGGGADARFGAVAAGLRFHSGTYATLDLRRARSADGDDESTPPQRRLYAAGPAFELDADLDDPEGTAREKLLRQETQAFLRALAAGRPAPVSLLDARPAMRLTERIMQRLR